VVGVRGYVWRKYVDDAGNEWALRVDADHAAIASRGWATIVAGTHPLPRECRPRRVFGYSPTTGRPGMAIVGTTTCDLWTGVATTFTVEANDQSTDTINVLHRIKERIAVPH